MYDDSTMYYNCNDVENIITARNITITGLEHQVKGMKIISDILHPSVKIDANVTVPISNVGKANGSLTYELRMGI